MAPTFKTPLLLLLSFGIAIGQEDAPKFEDKTESPPDEIAKIFAEAAKAIPKGPELDRKRGQIVFEAEKGEYMKG